MLQKQARTILTKATLFILLPVSNMSYGQAGNAIPVFMRNPEKDSLVRELSVIGEDDQKYRDQEKETGDKYGWDSKEFHDFAKAWIVTDSINLVKVTTILDKYGWLGTEVIGYDGNEVLFMVVQHSELIETQLKYLPMMSVAVKNGKLKASSFAMLEDRVALRQGKEQIYGSQVNYNMQTDSGYVLPLLDPDNVDKRRAEVGLPPLADYLSVMKIKWDPEQYKKDLPLMEQAFFKK